LGPTTSARYASTARNVSATLGVAPPGTLAGTVHGGGGGGVGGGGRLAASRAATMTGSSGTVTFTVPSTGPRAASALTVSFQTRPAPAAPSDASISIVCGDGPERRATATFPPFSTPKNTGLGPVQVASTTIFPANGTGNGSSNVPGIPSAAENAASQDAACASDPARAQANTARGRRGIAANIIPALR